MDRAGKRTGPPGPTCNDVTVVYFAVEGDTDVPVADRLIRHVGLAPHRAIVAGGVPKLDQRIPGLIRSATRINWLILRDLDRECCAPQLIRRLFARGIPSRVSLRIPVRSMESWMLADTVGFSEAFSVHRSRLPERPDDLENAKLYLANLCRSSRQSAVRNTIPPRAGSGRAVGPEYASRISAFARQTWNPERAAQRSPSLARAIRALVRLDGEGTWS